MYDLKRRMYEVVEASGVGDASSKAYDILMATTIIVGMIPLTLRKDNYFTMAIEIATCIILFIDYCARVYTADYKMGYKSFKAYVAYIFTPLAIFDLLSIVPIIYLFLPVSSSIGLLKLFRVFRVVKLIRYSKTMVIISNVFRKVKTQLVAVVILIVIYIIVAAMLIFQFEPDLFRNFFDAIYWATISITTIGYGDISPQTDVGRLIAIISAVMGVVVIALPSGMITAAYINEINKKKTKYEL
ncbi:MAG: potassium channel family protein [Lachnospiraceae bacterium]|nr:potassium channel family protein [Lachnospiraceae bacterium]